MSKRFTYWNSFASINPDFVSTWDTTQAGSASDTVILGLVSGGTYSGTIDWGDGSSSVLSYANRTHVYSTSGTYTITLSGTIEGWLLGIGSDAEKIGDISAFGKLTITTEQAFYKCKYLTISATDAPIMATTSARRMFRDCRAIITGVSGFDTSGVLNMSDMYYNAVLLNDDFSGHTINQVTNFTNFMFGVTLSTANYDALLIAWDAQGAMSFSGTVNFGGSQYTLGGAAAAARTSLISKWGGITDGGGV